MAIISCGECSHQVSDRAASCPSCGAPVTPAVETKPRGRRVIPKVLITLMALWTLGTLLWLIVPRTATDQLIALAKTKPGVLNYGSAGPASLAHLAGALFATLSDIELTHIPYKSSAQSVIDLISGRLDMQFATIAPTTKKVALTR